MDTRKALLPYLIIFTGALLFATIFYPRVGVGDTDAIVYIMGTHGLQDGTGYVDSQGSAITTWPFGYSLILSLFPIAPLHSATLFNNVCFALCTVFFYRLAKFLGWSTFFALSATIVVAGAFFRSIAFFAKPDILSYAVFLGAMVVYLEYKSVRGRVITFTLLNALILVKILAVTFTPALLLGELFYEWRQKTLSFKNLIVQSLYPLISWIVIGLGLLLYNQYVSGSAMPKNHRPASITGFFTELSDFVLSIFRATLAFWHGTLREPIPLALFLITIVLGVVALSTLRLRRQNRFSFVIALSLTVLVFALLSIRQFDAQMRTAGYGVLLLFLSLTPANKPWTKYIWAGYAMVVVVTACLNPLLVDGTGANHAMYEQLVTSLTSTGTLPATGTLYSNSEHILDIHAGRASVSSSTLPEPVEGNYYLLVQLPNVDGIMQTVLPSPLDMQGWCSTYESDTAILYHPCETSP